jgi:DNA-binding transcriptional ArsR family regulator
MASKKHYELHAEVFKALAHPLRIEIIDVLQKRELCFSDILESTGGIKSNLSQHLSMMVDKGILKSRKDSRCNYFSVASPKVAKSYELLRDLMVETINAKKAIITKARL